MNSNCVVVAVKNKKLTYNLFIGCVVESVLFATLNRLIKRMSHSCLHLTALENSFNSVYIPEVLPLNSVYKHQESKRNVKMHFDSHTCITLRFVCFYMLKSILDKRV